VLEGAELEGAVGKFAEEAGLGCGAEKLADEVAGFHDHELRHDECLDCLVEERGQRWWSGSVRIAAATSGPVSTTTIGATRCRRHLRGVARLRPRS